MEYSCLEYDFFFGVGALCKKNSIYLGMGYEQNNRIG